MNRPAHTLKRNKSSTYPEYLVFVDTETTQEDTGKREVTHHLRLGVGCYWRKDRTGIERTPMWLRFTKADEFWDWMDAKTKAKTVTYLISHNLAFDAQVLSMYPMLAARGWVLKFVYENSHTRIIRYGYPTHKYKLWMDAGKKPDKYKGRKWAKSVVCLDNSNLFRGRLAAWGDKLGLPKLTMPDEATEDETWFVYCKRDVEILLVLWREWFDFLALHDMGTWKPTIGSQAFAAFRHRFMEHPIDIHVNKYAVKLERDGYKGGRCEAFYVGSPDDGPLYKLDVSSMYPFVMIDKPYPTALRGYKRRSSVADLRRKLKYYLVMAEVTLKTDRPVFPIKMNKRNVYPVGRFRTILTTPELTLALEKGWVKAVGRIAWYRGRVIFDEYVKYFYALKQKYDAEGDKLRRTVVKLLLNSLYGKFGQKGYDDAFVGRCDPKLYKVSMAIDMDTGEHLTIYHAGGSILESRRKGEGYNSMVAIAAHVTAYGRIFLWELIATAGLENCYYTDTDCLVVNREGYDRLSPYIEANTLGKLELEGMDDRPIFKAPKDYVFAGEVRRKGIPKSAIPAGKDTWLIETWPSIKTHVKDNRPTVFVNKKVLKRLSYRVTWGVPLKSGRVKPFCLPMPAHARRGEMLEIAERDDRLEALRAARTVPAEVVFKFYDYHHGVIRRVRDRNNWLTTWDKAEMDTVADELGFADDGALRIAILAQVKLDAEIRSLARM